jgi:SSS family solute:Na+ symporter
MVSVVLTDYVQFIVLSLGMGLTTWWVWTNPDVNGFQGILDALKVHRPDYGIDPLVRQTTATGVVGIGLAWIVWQCMHWTATNTWQTQAFRTAAADSPRTAKIMWSLTGVNYFGRAIIPMLWGVAALAFFSKRGGLDDIKESIQAMPMFLQNLPAGLVGFLLAGMLAAMMSTHSGYLLAWSGVLTEDLVTPICRGLFKVDLKHTVRIWITRFFILCLAGWLLYWGLWFKTSGPIWDYLAITGTMYLSGSAALVAMGLYWRRANTRGAYMALLGGALPGIVYLTSRIATLIVEPTAREVGHIPLSAIAQFSAKLTEGKMGIISFPLAVLGMYLGSLWGERLRNQATGPRIGTGSFMASGGA